MRASSRASRELDDLGGLAAEVLLESVGIGRELATEPVPVAIADAVLRMARALRLLRPQAPPTTGRPWNVGPSPSTAEAELKLALRYRIVHKSLIEEPRPA